MSDERRWQEHRPTLAIDKVNMSLDHLGKLDLVQTRQHPLFRRRLIVIVRVWFGGVGLRNYHLARPRDVAVDVARRRLIGSRSAQHAVQHLNYWQPRRVGGGAVDPG